MLQAIPDDSLLIDEAVRRIGSVQGAALVSSGAWSIRERVVSTNEVTLTIS